MSSVSSNIAKFEHANEEIQRTTPTRKQQPDDHTGLDISFNSSTSRHSSDDDDEGSITHRASVSRKTRISKERPMRQQPEASPPPNSLAERRKARQQRKKQQIQAKSKTGQLPPSPRMSGKNGRKSQRPFASSPAGASKGLPSNRRVVHTVSTESGSDAEQSGDFLSPTRRLSPANAAKARRMHRMKQQEVTVGKEEGYSRQTGAEHDVNDDEGLANFHSQAMTQSPMDATDDEVTLTSVRQIMHGETQGTPEKAKPSPLRRTESASSYETEGSRRLYAEVPDSGSSRAAFLSHSHSSPTGSKKNSTSLLAALHRQDDDTFDYGDRDDDSQDSVGLKEKQKRAELKAQQEKKNGVLADKEATSPLMNKDDMTHYRETLDTPVARTAVGVAAAATCGALLLGPVGLLLGAAGVGIGIGVMQIPEEQRTNVKTKASKAFGQAKDSALNASDTLSSSCAQACHQTGVSEQVPSEMKQCFTGEKKVAVGDNQSMGKSVGEDGDRSVGSSKAPGNGLPGVITTDDRSSSPARSTTGRRVACLRNGRSTPVNQIHGLEPSQQPKAWLEVMASANTSQDEKNEAMEEIVILSKDKRRARILLDEGILDSLIYIINKHFEKVRNGGTILPEDAMHTQLAATCCVTLGKAHCAAVHTEGDLMLMSLYERGTVPEDRQLAQMLYEVPHHVTKDSNGQEIFVLQQMSMQKSEELATQIKALADGK